MNGITFYLYIAVHDASDYETHFSSLAQARGVKLPPFGVASTNISILILNSHPLLAPAQPLPPNVVYVAGYHIEESAPLPKDIQEIMDNSTQGVVYFSMGTIVDSLPEEVIRGLIKIFESLEVTVLWKKYDAPTKLPKNVHVRSWWPQTSILAHPNIRVFITHCGTHSTIEAVHYGVPIVAVPLTGDMIANARNAEQAGFARIVPLESTFVQNMELVLMDMLNNDSYYHRAKYVSKIFNKHPIPPSKLIPHYVELAIETKGAYHLRSPTYLYKWYERWMLDQMAFILVVLYVLKKVIQKACCMMCRKIRRMKKKGSLETRESSNWCQKKAL